MMNRFLLTGMKKLGWGKFPTINALRYFHHQIYYSNAHTLTPKSNPFSWRQPVAASIFISANLTQSYVVCDNHNNDTNNDDNHFKKVQIKIRELVNPHINVMKSTLEDLPSLWSHISTNFFISILNGIVKEFKHSWEYEMDEMSKTSVRILVGTFVGIHLLFRTAVSLKERSLLMSRLFDSLWNNFVLSAAHVSKGYWHVLMTSTITHFGIAHLLLNSLATFIIFEDAPPMIGNSTTWSMYLSGGFFSSWSTFLIIKYGKVKDMACIGASGAIYPVFTFTSFNADQGKRNIVQAFIIFELLRSSYWTTRMIRGTAPKLSINHPGHLAGIVYGLAFLFLLPNKEQKK